MYVSELTYPGTGLEHPDKDQARDMERLLSMIESQLTGAAVALNLFVQACCRSVRPPTEDMQDPEYVDRLRELENHYLRSEELEPHTR